ncbi:MAG: MBL fold metallo-hydrolase [Candidatus Eisenbacteria bacterium]
MKRARKALLASVLLAIPALAAAGANDATVYEIQQGAYSAYTWVTVDSIVVTAVISDGFFVEEAAGGPYGGILVRYGEAPPVSRGNLVTVSGYYLEQSGNSIVNASASVGGELTILGSGFPEPAADPVTVGDINTGSPTAEQWEGCLVTLDSVLCVSVGAGDWRAVEYDGEAPGETLLVDDLMTYAWPSAGDSLVKLAGVLYYGSSLFQLEPRSNFDVVGIDRVPPGTITDLGAAPGEYNGSALLTWTATGDDGSSGTASRYIARYASSPITAANWGAATDLSGEPAPQASGTPEGWLARGLPAGETVYLAIRAEDEANQLGGVSNSPSVVVTDAQPKLTIHCINVGQGDCTLIQTGTGMTFLYDAGYNGEGTAEVIPYLQGLGIDQLTYVGASHYDADHIGGLDEVVYAIGVDSASLDRGWTYTTSAYYNYVTAVGSLRRMVDDGDVIDLGDGVTVRCVCVNGNGLLTPPFNYTQYDENDLSVGYVVSVGSFQFFVGGDISGNVSCTPYHDIETSVGNEVGDIEVLRVNHHGSHCNSNWNFVNALSPEAAIISVGDGNPYGHPTSTVINRLVSIGAYIYQTELGTGGSIPAGRGEVAGDIVIQTNGHCTYTIQDSVYLVDAATGIRLAGAAPSRSILWPNAPNPFNPATTIRYDVAEPGAVRLLVLDVRGRVVSVLASEPHAAGSFTHVWNGTDAEGREVPSGVYFLRMENEGTADIRKMTLIR